MLQTPEERIKLLKAGLTGEAIEKLYIEHNNFKIVRTPPIIELVEFDFPQNKETGINSDVAVECAQSFHAEGTLFC
ncbi:MAG: hypothetical protein OIN66_04975 [Candidatus Methanoperedens sp.]|nr:hypothetical protein [Candidatus Methanoperedens sp.]